MNSASIVSPKELFEVLLHVAPVRPVFIWGPPGIGKSALVGQFAQAVGLPCVSLLGSQLAPEDIIGVPQILDGCSVFCPPRHIARKEAYCLFLDELNACSQEVQKAFYSLIHERRIGEYELPAGSVVVGAGNRTQDSAIVKPMSSALINRMVHFQFKVSSRQWLEWAGESGIHPCILEYVGIRPDHLWSSPPKTEEPFSTPRSWHMLSDAMKEYGDSPAQEDVFRLAKACLSPHHAVQFNAYIKQVQNRFQLSAIIDGKAAWPDEPEHRDVLYFLAQSLRARLIKELPPDGKKLAGESQQLAVAGKGLSVEEVYSRVTGDLRRYRKLATLRGVGLGDMLEKRPSLGPVTDLDAFCREAMMQGLLHLQERQRGTLPSGLIEEIHALAQPPIPWDVELARWFDGFFAPLEKKRL